MKAASPALAALINTGTFTAFYLYTIDMVGGGQLLFTAADVDITFGGTTWKAQGIRVASTSLAHWKVGLDVDQWQITLLPRARDEATGDGYPDKIGVAPWLQAAAAGQLDGAAVTVQRAFFSDPPTFPLAAGGAVPVGLITMFRGAVAECDVNTTMAVLTVNDARYILNTQMPRNLYQAGCRHRLFDGNCKLSAASFTKTGSSVAGSTRSKLKATVAAPGGSGTWQLGTVAVTSGANAGCRRTIAGWDGAQTFTLVAPFPFDFVVGDALSFTPGCVKTMTACKAFNNLLNYGGNPFVPVPETTG